MDEGKLKVIVEALLFASDEPLSAGRIAEIVGEEVKPGDIRQAVESLVGEYQSAGRAFTVEEVAGGYQLFSLPTFQLYLKKLGRAQRVAHLSQAAIETLAIVAYRQPITRAEIEDIRGVAAGDMLRSLIEKELVKVTGKADCLGHPLLYGTTKKFLEFFGLRDLKDLPKVTELVRPQEQPQAASAVAQSKQAEDVQAEQTADADDDEQDDSDDSDE